MWASVVGAVLGFFKALIGPVTGWLLGRAQKDRDHAEDTVDAVARAQAARRAVVHDADSVRGDGRNRD